MSFVTCKLYGRMGNQMFQIAATMGVAWKYGVEFVIPQFTGPSPQESGDPLYFTHFPKYNRKIHVIKRHWVEKDHGYRQIVYAPAMQLDGYFQSEKYFDHIREEVLMWFEKIFDLTRPLRPDTVALHVRRGDYVGSPNFPLAPMIYYDQAIEHFKSKGLTKVLVCSDDIAWCKDNLKQEAEFEFFEGDSYGDMWEMSRCAHQIISNSTFSWWSAWLNRNPNKQVLAPAKHHWFGSHVKMNMKDVIPATWKQIRYDHVAI